MSGVIYQKRNLLLGCFALGFVLVFAMLQVFVLSSNATKTSATQTQAQNPH